MTRDSRLVAELWPLILPKLDLWARNLSGGGAGGGGALTVQLVGTVTDAQAPQFLLRDGSRSLLGNLGVESGVTIDGVDLSAHAGNPAAHHDPVSAGDGIALTGQQVAVNSTVVRTSRQIISGDGLAGGGDLSANRTLAIDLGNDPGLELDAGKLRVKAGAGIARTMGGTAVDLATMPGLEFDTAKLQVQAGDGIARSVNGVDVVLSTPSGLELAGTSPDKTLQLADSIAGNGLTISSKVLHVGVANSGPATGLSVEADVVRLTASDNPGTAASILATSVTGSLQLVTLAANVGFASGFAGFGYRVDYGITEAGKASAEFDNLTVRGRMRVYELMIQQIRATNGSVFVASSSRAERITQQDRWMVNGEQLTFNGEDAFFTSELWYIDTRVNDTDDDRDLYHGFVTNDLVRAQRFEMDANGDFAQVRVSNLQIGSIYSLYEYVAAKVNGDDPVAGDDFVRLGNTMDTTRQGSVYLTADDSNAPFIDIVDNIASHTDWNTPGKIKVRLGRLTGITDSDFGGNLEGYGLYGNNVYLKGKIVVTGGNVVTTGTAASDVNSNTTTIDGGKITANSITADKVAFTASDVDGTNIVGVINGSTEGIRINANKIHISGDVTFASGYDPTGKIAAGGAAADVNANATTISGGKITTGSIAADRINVANLAAISADLGAVTAGSIVVGSTNKLWLNEGGDGVLAIGGSTKASAPFRVTAAGVLTASGSITGGSGNVKLDTDGLTIESPTSAAAATQRVKFRNTAGSFNVGEIHGRWSSDLNENQFNVEIPYRSGTYGYLRLKATSASNVPVTLDLDGYNQLVHIDGRFRVAGTVEVTGVSSALIVPSLSTTQRNALSAINGSIIYNVTDHKLQVVANSTWVNLH